MVPARVYSDEPAQGRIRLLRPRPDVCTLADIAGLESRSDRPEVQKFLTDAIRSGRVRVRPSPGSPGRVIISKVMADGRAAVE